MNIEMKNWKTLDSKDKTFDFFEYQDKDWVLIIFFRGKFCGFCRKFLMKINDNINKFNRNNIKLLAISGDSKLSAAVLKAFLFLPFPNLPDENLKIADLFGVKTEEKDGKKFILPSLFLINPKHEISWAFKGNNYEDFPEVETLLEEIKKNYIVI